MKPIIIIFLFLLSGSLTAQVKPVAKIQDSTSIKFKLLESRNQELQNQMKVYHSELHRLLDSQQKIKDENDLFKTTLETNTNLFNGISTFFTIVSILLTLIVIAIPLINYFLVLKPNEKVVEKVENLEADVLKTMEGNFESYFEKFRRQKTIKVLNLLNNPLNLSEVTGYFLLNDSANLEESDISKIIDFLTEYSDIEKSDAHILHSVVIHSGFLIAEKFYKSIFEKDDDKSIEFAIEYVVENEFESHIPFIEKMIKANEKGHHLLIKFFDCIQENYIGNWTNKKMTEKREIGISYAKLLFDNERILTAIEDKEIPKTLGFDEHPININRLNDNKFIRETKYYDVYLKEMDEKYK